MNDDFPYMNGLYEDNYIINKFIEFIDFDMPFKKLGKNCYFRANVKLPKIHFLYKYRGIYLLDKQPKTYRDILCIGDAFVDICRAHCNFKGLLTPYEYYQQNKEFIIDSLSKKQMDITKMNIRNEIYENNKECSSHNPAIIKKFIEKYKATKILDMSAGWGDRLLGTMGAKISNRQVIKYTAADPNNCIHECYKNMIKLLSKYSPNTECVYNIFKDGFENINIEKNYYDLAYTSPPYFDYEVYSQDDKQSINVHDNENSWYNNFLKPSVIKFIDGLVNGGHMILYIGQAHDKTYMEQLFEWIKYYDNVYYYGCVFYGTHYSSGLLGAHPMYVYKKSITVPIKLYNMEPIIEIIKHNNNSINIIMDNYMVGGLYTRFIFDYISQKLLSKLVLLCTDKINKYICISIAYSLYLLKKKDIKVIFYKFDYHEDIKKICNYFHKNITYYRHTYTSTLDDPKILYITNKIIYGDNCSKILFNNLKKYSLYNTMDNLWIFSRHYEIAFFIDVFKKLLVNGVINFVVSKDEYDVINEKFKNVSQINIHCSKYNTIDKYELEVEYFVDYITDAKVLEHVNDNSYVLNVANIFHYV